MSIGPFFFLLCVCVGGGCGVCVCVCVLLLFWFLCVCLFLVFGTTEICLGSTKWKCLPGKHFLPGKKMEKVTLLPPT